MSRALGIAIAIVMALQSYVSAQTPSCLPGYSWSFNSLNQSPCDMTVYLGGVCQSAFTLSPLQPGFVYLGPSIVNVNPCRCSSVYYSLLSACAVCQNQTYLSWSLYDGNCSTIYDQVFLDPIPAGTRIPHYAYLDVESTNGFSVPLAESAVGAESTPVAQPTSVTSISTPTSSAVKSSKSKAGPIAGGVIGGVVFLAIVVGLVTIILRRRKRSTLPTDLSVSPYSAVASPDTSMSYGNVNNSLIQTSMTSGKIYDPNDPSTFPTPTTYPGTYSPDYNQQVTPNFTGNTTPVTIPASVVRSQYTGAPEL